MHLLYDSTPAEFRSAYGIAGSVERLSAATKRSVFSALGETTAVGKGSEKVVRLQRVIPMVGNSFKPFFIGHFEVRGEVTVLIGKFTRPSSFMQMETAAGTSASVSSKSSKPIDARSASNSIAGNARA
jgi:hypothetical protein